MVAVVVLNGGIFKKVKIEMIQTNKHTINDDIRIIHKLILDPSSIN